MLISDWSSDVCSADLYATVGIRAFAAACGQLPATVEDAARVFGAGYGTRLARIVVPLHARAFIGAWLLTLLFCLRDLETATLFYPPGKEPLSIRIFTLEANGDRKSTRLNSSH